MKKDINIESINNKKVENSKDGYRPDFLINYGTHYILVEVDENQHKRSDYTVEKELKRNISLRTNLIKPVLFIRLNTDHYFINGKSNYTLLNDKLQVLLKIINKNKDKIVDGEIVYLYYDCSCDSVCNNIH